VHNHHRQHVFTPTSSITIRPDSDGSRKHDMPKHDPTSPATVFRSHSHAVMHARFGAGIVGEASAVNGIISIPPHGIVLLTGAAADAAAMADAVFVQNPQGGLLEIMRGTVRDEMVFRD
jgi:hypothetical protein